MFIQSGEKSQKYAQGGALATTLLMLLLYFGSVVFYSEKQLALTLWPTLTLTLVVTHSVILKSLIMYMKGKSIKDLWAPPFIHDTSLTILEIKNGMHHLLSEGDVTHLKNVTSV
ncbi:GerAB/ArcD/ProY family transporter [Peribacillus frigoritolerans]|uniref:GerAB/ArcD/ProY family transporter n=1 Tax=Peribacillus frigoritolerans TaxID=450367 RepID=UPI00220C0DCD|nr:GerAB/ArcD/ProY family transporter [Peribacillus frigoritolerans]USK68271.1 GerAB/ArcD/ProY family transporter [Peribacillus frigoritolerans]